MITKNIRVFFTVVSFTIILAAFGCSKSDQGAQEAMYVQAPKVDEAPADTEQFVEPETDQNVFESGDEQPEDVGSIAAEGLESAEIQANQEIDAPYTIQVAVYKTSEEANALAETLTSEGYRATVSERVSKRGTHFFRVWVGDFANADEADGSLTALRVKFADCFVLRK